MERRVNGFVAGRITVRGESMWKVKVTDEGSLLNGESLPVVSVGNGVTLMTGLEVDFSIGQLHHHSAAVDVAPRGVKEQGRKAEMTRTRWIMGSIVALSTIVVTVCAVTVWQGPIGQWLKDRAVKSAILAAVDRVEQMPFTQMVTGDTIAKIIEDRHAGMRGARKVLLDRELCRPAFGDRHDDAGQCWNALYYGYGNGQDNWGYQKYGIPQEMAPRVYELRKLMLEKGRKYLASPSRLRAYYTDMKPTALEAYRGLPKEKRESLAKWLNEAVTAFERFYDPDVQTRYAEYIEAYDAWWTSERDTSSPEKERERMQRYRVMKEKEDALHERSPNLYFTLFAGRRHAEGGKELVLMWTELLRDAQASIK
jgi:hypothetical protein